MENYDGITILTSNSKARFDSGFARRLDFIIDFDLPGPEERRALWLSHLGTHHTLTDRELNRLAALVDLGGGHIRTAVFMAALPARSEQRPVTYADCVRGLETEFRKMGRNLPAGLVKDGGAS
jgi:hypothetical protein